MNILLKSLDLVHFKCFPKLHLDFHEGVNNIYGENAAGKTSVYDALTWLMFNKDSAGNARPDIKPHHAPAGTMPEVTAVLEVDGEPIKLRKVLREKWEKPRGSSIERYAGDTRDYYIDDVPLAENEYKRRIAELIDEQQFKLLTDVWAAISRTCPSAMPSAQHARGMTPLAKPKSNSRSCAAVQRSAGASRIRPSSCARRSPSSECSACRTEGSVP